MKTRWILTGFLLATFAATTWADTHFSFRVGFGVPCRPVCTRRVRRCPARRIVVRHTRPRGEWRTVVRRVWVPGRYERVTIPAQTETVFVRGHFDACGNYISGHTEVRVITPERTEVRWHAGHYRTTTERVWVPF
jgi:hypothetical protein